MGGKQSQRKGAAGERELAAILQKYGYDCTRGGSKGIFNLFIKEECPLWNHSRECGLHSAIDSLETIAENLNSIDYSCEQIANSR